MSNYSKGIPKNNIRYRSNKSPEEQKPKNTKEKRLSVIEEMQQMKQRREDRKKRIEDEKQHKKDLLNDPNYIPKLDYDFEYLVHQKKFKLKMWSQSPIQHQKGKKYMFV